MQIDAAADHGVNVFIYDWYWYDGRPFLEQCLNNGFLQARNRGRMKFYLMWANHGVTHLWDKRIAHVEDNVIWRAGIDRQMFEQVGRRWIERYFHDPGYYTIDDKPVLMIYDLHTLVSGLGGVNQAAESRMAERGSPAQRLAGVHLQLTSWGASRVYLSGADGRMPTADVLQTLGFESQTHYQFVHFTDIDRDYTDILLICSANGR